MTLSDMEPTPPTTPAIVRRSTLLGLAEHVWHPETARWRFRARWKPIVATFVSLAVIGYLGLAGALYARDRWMRGCENTSYREMLLLAFPDPIYFTDIHWAPGFVTRRLEIARKSHAKKMATVLFNRAKAAYDNRDYKTFYQDVLVAAQIDPSNTEARQLASAIFAGAHREDDALDTLEQALPSQLGEPKYIGDYLALCFREEKEARVVGIAKYFLAKPDLSPQVREIFSTAMAAAQFYRGEFDDCLKTIDTYNLGRTREGFLLGIRVLWETGKHDEAIAKLEPVAMSMTNLPQLMEMLIDLKLKNNDRTGARSSASVFLLRTPDSHQARIKMIEILDLTGEKTRRDEEIARYRHDFAGKQAEMMRLCEFCADRGLVALCSDMAGEAEKAGYKDAPRFRLLYIESHLAAGRFAEAIAMVDRLFVANPGWLADYRLEFDCLRMVAQMAISKEDLGDISFRRLAENKTPLRMPLMTVVAKKLIQVGRPDDAMRIIDFAYERNGRDLTSLANVIDIHLAAGGAPSTPDLVRSQLLRRRPPTDTLVSARRVIAGDAYLFEPHRSVLIDDIDKLIAGKPMLPPVGPKTPVEKVGGEK